MDPTLFTDIGILLVAYSISLGLSVIVRSILIKQSLLDHPNERSSHAVPVPRGGGLVLLIVLIPGMIGAALIEKSLTIYSGLIVGTILLGLISWHDDRKGASPFLRLSMHVVAACLGSLAFPPQATIFGNALPFWLDRTLMIVGWTWFINMYNFMDGIDGITGVETIFISAGVCLISAMANMIVTFDGVLVLLLTGSCLGFLALNWHPAKIFLGDVGSVPLGYLSAYLLITLAVKGLWAPAIILVLYYAADSGITLLRRAAKGEKIWVPHCQHFYQRAAKRKRHDRVVWFIVIANAGLLIAACVAVSCPWSGVVASIVIVALLLNKLHKLA